MSISGSSMSQNVAFTLGYSAITLHNRIHVVVNGTVFNNNTAFIGGAMFAEDHCRVTLTNCTFSANKAITGKTLTAPKAQNLDVTISNAAKNGTLTPNSPLLI